LIVTMPPPFPEAGRKCAARAGQRGTSDQHEISASSSSSLRAETGVAPRLSSSRATLFERARVTAGLQAIRIGSCRGRARRRRRDRPLRRRGLGPDAGEGSHGEGREAHPALLQGLAGMAIVGFIGLGVMGRSMALKFSTRYRLCRSRKGVLVRSLREAFTVPVQLKHPEATGCAQRSLLPRAAQSLADDTAPSNSSGLRGPLLT
jgi:hypothetical protein